jgi:ribosome-binding protein aMBF1 (putative translation factor)
MKCELCGNNEGKPRKVKYFYGDAPPSSDEKIIQLCDQCLEVTKKVLKVLPYGEIDSIN